MDDRFARYGQVEIIFLNMEKETNEKNYVSIGNGSWFNKVKQNSDNAKPGNTSFCKIVVAVLSALAAIAGILVALLKFNIIQLPQ